MVNFSALPLFVLYDYGMNQIKRQYAILNTHCLYIVYNSFNGQV